MGQIKMLGNAKRIVIVSQQHAAILRSVFLQKKPLTAEMQCARWSAPGLWTAGPEVAAVLKVNVKLFPINNLKMKNKRGAIFAIFLIILIFGIFFANSAQEDKNKVSGEVYKSLENNEEVNVIIKIKQEINLFRTSDLNSQEIIRNLKYKNSREYQNLISAKVSEKELEELEKNSNVESITLSHQIRASLQDSVPLINATNVWPIQISNINITGTDETICIIDTGINFTHPDLIGKNKTCIIDCYNKNCIENCSLGDDNGHGTHVAGIAAASGGINGVGINISLIGVKVLDSNGNGHETHSGLDLANAIDWCVTNKNNYNISVISMSLGTTSYLNSTYCDYDFADTWTRAINNATFYNISVIAATGNSGSPTAISSPACIENATAAGAATKADAIDSSYSNRNSITDLLAPGTSINSTFKGENCLSGCACSGNYMVCSGTSMATPHVAGAFALIRQFFRLQNGRAPTPSEIQNLLNSTGKQINDTAGNNLTFSRIDVYSAISSIWKRASVNFISPADNSYINSINQNQTFVCNVTGVNSNLTNITFYLWNSSALVYNLTSNITGTSNSSTFYYNFSAEDIYLWNCIAYNNDNFSNSNSNYTLTYDITNPVISSVSSSVTTDSSAITWATNENANSSVNYGTTGSLGSFANNSSFITSHSIALSGLSSSTTYYYNITSCDRAGNCITNGTYSFTTSAPAPPVTSSGGGGGAPISSAKTYELTIEQASQGYTQSLSKNDKIKFTFFDEKASQHTLTLNAVGENFVNLTIQSNILRLVLGIRQSAKLNLTGSDYYDLYVKLNFIANNKADIEIQAIHEEIPKPKITGQVSKEENQEKDESELAQQTVENIMDKIKNALIVILVIGVLVLLAERITKKEKIEFKKQRKLLK